jgi:predicted pyridoxine 5'-phosphate oxidase superfamily flavin-nucleotide-binding protein
MSHRIQEWLQPGASIIVATADAEGVPSTCRGIAIAARGEADTLTVYLPAATAHEALANIATTRRIAVGASHPLSHSSVQIKGVTRGVKMAPAADEAFVRERWEAFAAVLAEIGLPRRIMHGVAHWPAFAVEMSIEQVFNQTPGPNAGAPIA